MITLPLLQIKDSNTCSLENHDYKKAFYYISFECNLNCIHCYVGDNLAPQVHADFDAVISNIERLSKSGVEEITFLGGEPTLHPKYNSIIQHACSIGFSKVIVDTNGINKNPIPSNFTKNDILAIRFSMEGSNGKTHDYIRGRNTFKRMTSTLRRIVERGNRVEITFTINTMNYKEIQEVVIFAINEGVQEVNFHFTSLMGNGKRSPYLGLSVEDIVLIQDELDNLRKKSPISIRYPKLLVRKDEFSKELDKGLCCRIYKPEAVLIFPNGTTCQCPLQINKDLSSMEIPCNEYKSNGCPLYWRFFPNGIHDEYMMTCVSWKSH
jgi:MoaA/NifB/PqqE/SkfB family radical SAM enzyme